MLSHTIDEKFLTKIFWLDRFFLSSCSRSCFCSVVCVYIFVITRSFFFLFILNVKNKWRSVWFIKRKKYTQTHSHIRNITLTCGGMWSFVLVKKSLRIVYNKILQYKYLFYFCIFIWIRYDFVWFEKERRKVLVRCVSYGCL